MLGNGRNEGTYGCGEWILNGDWVDLERDADASAAACGVLRVRFTRS